MVQEKINKRIVLAGGPSTGKTSVLNKLIKLEYHCFQEAAREIFTEYQKRGSDFISRVLMPAEHYRNPFR